MKCPGQDTRYWKPNDIFDEHCSRCGNIVEFFKDDGIRKCSHCGYKIKNPKVNVACDTYCEFADHCKEYIENEI